MGLMNWTITAALLTALCVPFSAAAEDPATRPASAERRDEPESARRRQGPPPGQFIEQLRGIAKDLDLTDEQKTQVEAALKTAADDFKAARDELESMEPRERRDRAETIFGKLRQDVNTILTDEQRQTLRKQMSALRPGGGQRPTGEDSAATTRPTPFVDGLQQNLATLELTDEQQKKIGAVLADAKTQMEEVREGLLAGDEQARAKAGGVMIDVRRQIGEILTPQQRKKLSDLITAGGASAPGQRPQRDKKRSGGDDMMGGDDAMMGGEMRDAGPPRTRPKRNERRRREPATAPAPGAGATIGSPAPPFELTKLDGKPFRSSTFAGRVGVIVFGSYSSPSFRQRAAAIESLARQFGSRAQFLIVYTKEAHPVGEWDVDRNKDEGIAVEPHKDVAARVAQAEKAKSALGLTIPIAPDTMDDAVSGAFGAFPNGAIVLSRDGVIVARQQWVDPGGLERRIEQALKVPATKPAK